MNGRSAWQAWLIIAAGGVAALQVGKLPPALPWLQAQLGLSLLDSGFLLSVVQGSGMLLGLMVGQWIDGYGLRRSMWTGLMLLSAGSFMGGMSDRISEHTVWVLLASRVVEGLGFLLTVLPGPGLLRRHVESDRLAPFLGYWGTYMPLGMSLALLVGPFWLQAAPWSSWWFFFAFLSALMAMALRRGVAPDPEPDGAPLDLSSIFARLRQTLGASGPWLIAAMFCVYSAQWLSLVGFLPSIYSAAGVQGAMLAVLTALAAAVNMGGNMVSGRLLQRGWSERSTLLIGYGAMALGSFLAFSDLTLGVPWVRYSGILLFSCVGGLIPGTLFSLSVRLAPAPNLVASTVGWMQQLSATGQFLGPPLAAALAMAVGGWQFTWVFTATCCILGVVFASLVSRHPLVRQ
ncbi:MAG: MFS transporter [Alphaproteobacteria bacterium]|nr:MFS transporter [Alphaproteobacteria bacterium]MDI9329848.1 MFS transporter [Alphaproteobacteria bacterium]